MLAMDCLLDREIGTNGNNSPLSSPNEEADTGFLIGLQARLAGSSIAIAGCRVFPHN